MTMTRPLRRSIESILVRGPVDGTEIGIAREDPSAPMAIGIELECVDYTGGHGQDDDRSEDTGGSRFEQKSISPVVVGGAGSILNTRRAGT